MLKLFGEVEKPRLEARPVIQRGLQRRDDRKGIGRAGQVPGDNDEPPITAVLQ